MTSAQNEYEFLVNDIVASDLSKFRQDFRIDLGRSTKGFRLTITNLSEVDAAVSDLSQPIESFGGLESSKSVVEYFRLYDLFTNRLAFYSSALCKYILEKHPSIVYTTPDFDPSQPYRCIQLLNRSQKVLIANGEDVLNSTEGEGIGGVSGSISGAYFNGRNLLIVHRDLLEVIPNNQLGKEKLKELNAKYFNDGREINSTRIEELRQEKF